MLVLRIVWLGILLWVIPAVVGSLFANVNGRHRNLPFLWISGQMLLWAGFQMITVPLVLTEGSFDTVVRLFSLYMAGCLTLAMVLFVRRRKKGAMVLCPVDGCPDKQEKRVVILWVLFWVILVLQLVASFLLAYADGDDAFYVATATIAEESDTMYRLLAYTGRATGLDVRYGLAPFPMWIAYMARVTGIRTVMVAQLLVPPVLIAMAYGVYYLVGSRLFGKKKELVPLFLIFAEFLILFGDYSMYTPEKFLIARSRQGKAALAAIVIPFLIYLLLILLDRLEEKKKLSLGYWCLLVCGLTSACLCTTLGAVLACMLIGLAGMCAAVCYRKWKLLLPMAACCVPCVAEALLYLMH